MTSAGDDNSLREAMVALKTRDPLTGLINRSHFIRLLGAALGKPQGDTIRALFCIRPDGFGEIDDRLGPLASDALLKELGTLIEGRLPERCRLARFGGTSFMALAVDEEIESFTTQAERVLGAIGEHLFEVGSQSARLTVSIGVVILPTEMTDVEEALLLAQETVRRARDAGGNRVELELPLDAESLVDVEVAGWARQIRAALENDSFRLVWQPIASLDGTVNFSYDVLLRMLDEDEQDIMPGDFLPAAERAGLTPQIDRWVLDNAFMIAANRHAIGKRTRIFLRISEASLQDRDFVAWLGPAAISHRLDVESVVLQLGESAVERCLPAVRELSEACSNLHLKLSLANLRTDGKAVKLLREIDFDFLVIDSGYIKDVEAGTLQSLLAVAKEKFMPVIATRVETASDLARLHSLGVDFVTGFHVHEPRSRIAENIRVPKAR